MVEEAPLLEGWGAGALLLHVQHSLVLSLAYVQICFLGTILLKICVCTPEFLCSLLEFLEFELQNLDSDLTGSVGDIASF